VQQTSHVNGTCKPSRDKSCADLYSRSMNMLAHRAKWIGYGLTFIGAALFSTKAIFIKLAYREEVNATLLVAWRMIFATPVFIVVGVFAFLLQRQKGATVPRRNTVLGAAAVGALGYGVSAYLDFKGLEFITAQLERLVLFTYPLFIMFLGALFFNQKITRYGMTACVITYLGLAIVVGLDVPAGGWNTVIGTSLVLVCAITFALNQLYAKQLITVLGSVFYTSISMVAGGIAAVLIHTVSDGDFGASSFFLWMALGTAIFATVLPIFCINAGLAYTSAQTVGMISTISPLVTIILAVTILGEPFTLVDAMGSALVLAGVGYYTWADMRAKSMPPAEV
jgi:drug/metabolite transporter (DMT)-like permease